ncbi:MAG: ABC transporter permease [Lachnospiraceae bacterium]|nr:ABC transporter permease [Lachnospiraceae bacterium]
MMMLLVLKERLKSFYGKYAVLVDGVIRFFFSFTALYLLNTNIGFMAVLKEVYVAPALALLCAFLPYSAISFLLAAVMVVHLYAVSAEIALVTAVILILITLLYYGFQPGDSYWLVLTPIAFFMKIPFVIPVLAGLSGRVIAIIPVGCGTMIYYILLYVKQNAGPLTNDASVDITQKFVQIIRAIMSNKAMLVMILACFVGILVVYVIRTLSVDYAWVIAIVAGMVAQLAMIFVGDYLFDVTVPIVELIAGVAVSVVIAGLYHFLVFAVDYTRTEYTQFEDDDYVYYVKAVPKIVVSKPDVKVQRINNPEKVRRGSKETSGHRAK